MAEDKKVLREIWGETHSVIKSVRDVSIKFRTLFDQEEFDCLVRATGHEAAVLQEFSLIRWQLAYAIQDVAGEEFAGTVEAKYNEILKWPNVIIRLCAEAYYQVYQEEDDLIRTLGESGGAQLPMGLDSSYEPIGSPQKPSDLEIGQLEVPDSDETLSN